MFFIFLLLIVSFLFGFTVATLTEKPRPDGYLIINKSDPNVDRWELRLNKDPKDVNDGDTIFLKAAEIRDNIIPFNDN